MQLWGWITCQTLVSLPLLVPAIVWLAVGIPVNISQQGFGFFFAIWFTGGIGIIGQGVGWLADPFKLSPAVRAYVLTSKRALIAVGTTVKRSRHRHSNSKALCPRANNGCKLSSHPRPLSLSRQPAHQDPGVSQDAQHNGAHRAGGRDWQQC